MVLQNFKYLTLYKVQLLFFLVVTQYFIFVH